MNMNTRTLLCLTLTLFSGCLSVGPDYVAPSTPLPDSWAGNLPPGVRIAESPAAMAAWWEKLNDPGLVRIMSLVAEKNPDLLVARARVREARARRGLAGAELFPTVNAAGSAQGSATTIVPESDSTNSSGDLSTVILQESLNEDPPAYRQATLYEAGLDAAWELDVFGGGRRSVEAAEADLEAGRAAYRDTLVSLLAETALAYVELRAYEQRLTIARENLASQEETMTMVGWRLEAGLAGSLDWEQARQNAATTRASIPHLEQGYSQSLYRIATLTGTLPQQLESALPEVTEPGKIPVPPVDFAIGIPADVLRRRPDIRGAERNLAAATARIGVAEADLYPKLSLPGSLSYSRTIPGSEGWTASAGIGIQWNVFDAGAIRRNIDIRNALAEQALHEYESTVSAALEEVQNALRAYEAEQVRRSALLEATDGARTAAQLTEQSYSAGITDFQDVLTAQQSLRNIEDQLIQNEGAIVTGYVQLYKALGGEWDSQPTP